MRNEKKSGNTNIFKEVVMVCLLLLFFFILIMVGRLIVDKVNNERTIENGQTPTNFDNVSFEQHISGEETKKEILEKLGIDISKEKEDIDDTGNIDDYEIETESLRISDFKISDAPNCINVQGSVTNLTDKKLEKLMLVTKVYDEEGYRIQTISTYIMLLNEKESVQYEFSVFQDYDKAKKIKVEVLKDGIIQGEDETNIDRAVNN